MTFTAPGYVFPAFNCPDLVTVLATASTEVEPDMVFYTDLQSRQTSLEVLP